MDITISKGDGTPKIYYFGFYGRAEPIRMIMEVAGVKYDDVRMSFEQFGALKQSGALPTGQVPLYVDESGRQFNQTGAIMIMLARKHGLYSNDAEECYINDWAIDTMADLMTSDFVGLFFKDSLTD